MLTALSSVFIHVRFVLQSALAILTNVNTYGRNESCAAFDIAISILLEETLHVFPELVKSLKLSMSGRLRWSSG